MLGAEPRAVLVTVELSSQTPVFSLYHRGNSEGLCCLHSPVSEGAQMQMVGVSGPAAMTLWRK